MAKRSLPTDEFDDLASATASTNASIHALVVNVSPMKKGKKAAFFDGKMTDGTKHIRFVGFQPSLQKQMNNFCVKGDTVQLHNCELKQGRGSDDLEIIVKNNSLLQTSPKKFKVDNISAIASGNISLSDLPECCNYDKVTFAAKVINISDPTQVADGRTKQDIAVADTVTSVRVTLWENTIGTVSINSSYKFSNFIVRNFGNEKYLSEPKEGASITEIPDIGDVHQDLPGKSSSTIHVQEIAGVLSFSTYPACLTCNKKVVPTANNLGRCSSCNSLQRINRCTTQTSAKLLLSSGGDAYLQLLCFGSNLADIVQTQTVTEEGLLTAQPFTATYLNNVITGVLRP